MAVEQAPEPPLLFGTFVSLPTKSAFVPSCSSPVEIKVAEYSLSRTSGAGWAFIGLVRVLRGLIRENAVREPPCFDIKSCHSQYLDTSPLSATSKCHCATRRKFRVKNKKSQNRVGKDVWPLICSIHRGRGWRIRADAMRTNRSPLSSMDSSLQSNAAPGISYSPG